MGPSSGVEVVLLHSPLLGPLSWEFVAERIRTDERTVVVPDLTTAAETGSPLSFLTATAETISPANSAMLVGHSGAGPLLPAIADAAGNCAALIYVDAGLPHPGKSWKDTAPPSLVTQLESLADVEGILPRWSEWFGPGAIDQLLPERVIRERFVRELPRLPLRYFEEPIAPAIWDGPKAYLQLSPVYVSEADHAVAAGWPVQRLASHHLAAVTDPTTIAEALDVLLANLQQEARGPRPEHC